VVISHPIQIHRRIKQEGKKRYNTILVLYLTLQASASSSCFSHIQPFPPSLLSMMQFYTGVRKTRLLEHTGGTLTSNNFSDTTANPSPFSP